MSTNQKRKGWLRRPQNKQQRSLIPNNDYVAKIEHMNTGTSALNNNQRVYSKTQESSLQFESSCIEHEEESRINRNITIEKALAGMPELQYVYLEDSTANPTESSNITRNQQSLIAQARKNRQRFQKSSLANSITNSKRNNSAEENSQILNSRSFLRPPSIKRHTKRRLPGIRSRLSSSTELGSLGHKKRLFSYKNSKSVVDMNLNTNLLNKINYILQRKRDTKTRKRRRRRNAVSTPSTGNRRFLDNYTHEAGGLRVTHRSNVDKEVEKSRRARRRSLESSHLACIKLGRRVARNLETVSKINDVKIIDPKQAALEMKLMHERFKFENVFWNTMDGEEYLKGEIKPDGRLKEERLEGAIPVKRKNSFFCQKIEKKFSPNFHLFSDF